MNYYGNKVAVLTTQKKYEEAHKVLAAALEKYSSLDYSDKDFVKIAKLYARKARLFELEKKFDEAIEWCEKSLLENHDYKVKKQKLSLLKKKKQAEALLYINPELAEEHRQKGNGLFKEGKFPAAL